MDKIDDDDDTTTHDTVSDDDEEPEHHTDGTDHKEPHKATPRQCFTRPVSDSLTRGLTDWQLRRDMAETMSGQRRRRRCSQRDMNGSENTQWKQTGILYAMRKAVRSHPLGWEMHRRTVHGRCTSYGAGMRLRGVPLKPARVGSAENKGTSFWRRRGLVLG